MVKRILDWKIFGWLRNILEYLKPMNISIHAAYTSFFLILSVFPALMILFGVLAYTPFGVAEVLVLLEEVLPAAFMPFARRLLSGAYEHTSGTVLSLSAVTALWSASRGMHGLLEGLNAVYGLKEKRNYFLTRSISVLYTFLFVLVLLLTMVLHVFGTTILDYLRMTTDPVLLFLMDVIDLRFFLLLFLQIALFTAIYAVLPNRRNSIGQSFPGAVLASIGWLTFSDLFSIYVEHFPNYANIFGSVYAVALAMLWLYWCICIVFYGGALNRFFMERKRRTLS